MVPPLPWWQGQIDFPIPLSKVSKCHEDYEVMFPPGSLFDPEDVARPHSPTTSFDFCFDPTYDQALEGMLAELPIMPTTMDSVTHIVSLPNVCGLFGDTSIPVVVQRGQVYLTSGSGVSCPWK